jgi:hypothetical protein
MYMCIKQKMVEKKIFQVQISSVVIQNINIMYMLKITLDRVILRSYKP